MPSLLLSLDLTFFFFFKVWVFDAWLGYSKGCIFCGGRLQCLLVEKCTQNKLGHSNLRCPAFWTVVKHTSDLVAKSCQTLATPWTVAWRLLCPWDSPGKNIGVGIQETHFMIKKQKRNSTVYIWRIIHTIKVKILGLEISLWLMINQGVGRFNSGFLSSAPSLWG